LTLQNKSEPHEVEQILSAFSGEQRNVLEYLADEVLAAQSESIQEFLLQTSVLNQLTGSVCDALTGRDDSSVLLEQLERANMFVMPLGGNANQRWYRSHVIC
jgi:LuxR family maltose regulon positive regulatory protein